MITIQDELRRYIVENYLFAQTRTLRDDDSFMDLGLIDSTGVLELVSYLEEQYSIVIDANELIPDNLDSIERLTRFVAKKLGNKAVSDAVQVTAEEAVVSAGGSSALRASDDGRA